MKNVTILVRDNCKDDLGILLPLIPYENSWNPGVRASLYFAGLFYCFIGVAIVAEVFMGAIETITSKTKKIFISSKEGMEPKHIEVRIWNDTVANLTLMALGSSAPEILLSIIEIVGRNFEAGELGPGTIVGSAAFNLLIITAICIMAIPGEEVKRIKMIQVFGVTSVFSLFAYIWLIIVLEVISPDRVEVWEAICTLALFPILVLVSYAADSWGKKKGKYDVNDDDDPQIELNGYDEGLLQKKKTQLFDKNGHLNKSGLIEFYKGLRKYTDLTDTDAAALAAAQLITNKPRSRLWYRIGACRDIMGSRKIRPALNKKLKQVYEAINAAPDVPDIGPLDMNLLNLPTPDKAIIEFTTSSFSVPENIGHFEVKVVRHGKLDNGFRVKVESFDGTAKAGEDYHPVKETIIFKPFEKEKLVSVGIIDDNQWEPDEEFFLRLAIDREEFGRNDVALGRLPIMEIVILDDDEPGVISFKKRGILVKESCRSASVEVERTNGADGEVSVKWRTIDGTAFAPRDYCGGDGIITFNHGETMRFIEISIVNDYHPEKEECFEIELYDPAGGVKLGRISKTAVTITNDADFNSVLQTMMQLTSENVEEMEVSRRSWRRQIQDSLILNGGDFEGATSLDYFMHFISFFWKVLFSLIPPPGLCGGWLCFTTSLAAIGILTAIIGDLAAFFGCLVGLKDTVTAITFVALGTSLPDLFASKSAATQEKCADNAVGNVTGSNSVNVFLGLGLPWVLASVYHLWSEKGYFEVPAHSLVFSVLVYSITAFLALGLLFIRRKSAYFGRAELGGPSVPKYFSGVFLITLWFIYIILSSLEAYKHFSF